MHDFIRRALPVPLAVGALYLTIWPHELGHSLMAVLWGCKEHGWQTATSWYLWNSRAGAVDWACLGRSGPLAEGLTDFAGIAVNFILLAVAPLLGGWGRRQPRGWRFVGTLFWALANYAEAFSYLVLNTLWLKSDMATVVRTSGVSRWVWCAAGLLAGALIARGLSGPLARGAELLASPRVPARAWRRIFILYAAASGLTMSLARVLLT